MFAVFFFIFATTENVIPELVKYEKSNFIVCDTLFVGDADESTIAGLS